MKININGRDIGDGCPPFIIAEIGSNWQTLGDCLHSIRQAKLCGADAAKFQLYDWNSLYGHQPYISDRHAAGALPAEWLPHLKAECDLVGIEFMCSAFSPELVEAVNPFVKVHKVASAECTHVRILEKLREFGKPVFLSTGGHGVEDIGRALSLLDKKNTVLMYCVSGYPAQEIDLASIHVLSETFGTLCGYSDHSTDALIIPKLSVTCGASVLEKHVTFIEAETPDSAHSLSGAQFQKMVSIIRAPHIVTIGPTPEEKPMILRHNRRLIATAHIKSGDMVIEGTNFGIYRSLSDDTHAFSPFMVNEVDGRVALRHIKAGSGIGPGDV